jgi:hypothetical protein
MQNTISKDEGTVEPLRLVDDTLGLADGDEGVDGVVDVLLRVSRGDLHANARLVLGHDLAEGG